VPIEINDEFMRLEMDGRIIAVARERSDGWWEVSHWPRFFDRNQAITALNVAELLHSGHDRDDPLVRALHEELRVPEEHRVGTGRTSGREGPW
jgi:hypothetical protein